MLVKKQLEGATVGFVVVKCSLAGGGLGARLRPRREAIAEVVGTGRRAQRRRGLASVDRLDDRAALLRRPGLDQHRLGDDRRLSEAVGAQRRSDEGGACGWSFRAGGVRATGRGGTGCALIGRRGLVVLGNLLVWGRGLIFIGGGACWLGRWVLLHATLPGSPWARHLAAVGAASGSFVHPAGGYNSLHGSLRTETQRDGLLNAACSTISPENMLTLEIGALRQQPTRFWAKKYVKLH